MKNKKQLRNILEELYKLDPKFRDREDELIKILNKLMKNKPEIKIDQNFVRRLKKELMLEVKGENEKNLSFWSDFFTSKWFLLPAGAGVLLMFLVVFSSLFLGQISYEIKTNLSQKGQDNFGSLKIEKLEDNAFGQLAFNENQNGQEQSLGVNGGGQLTKQVRSDEVLGLGAGEGSAISAERMPIIAPNRINYEFVYRGEAISQDKEKLPVFKKMSQDSLKKAFSDSFSNLNLDLINLNKFNNLEISNLNLVEDDSFGYFVNFDFNNGSISVNKNWSTWPNPSKECRDEACYNSFRLKMEDVPSDNEIISLANKFLEQVNINRNLYGSPRVQDYWRKNYELSVDKENFYIPSEISVVYPYEIEGKQVYEESGELSGLYVSVDISSKKASGIRNLFDLKFQSSDYDVITDSEKIISIAKDGGLRKTYNYEDPTEIVTIELNSPSLELVKIWNFNRDKMLSSELFVPAYVFPVESVSKETYYSGENIVVPLVEEFINSYGPVFGIMGEPKAVE